MQATRIPPRASRNTIEPEAYDDVDADVRPPRSAVRLSKQTQTLIQPKSPPYRFTGVWRSGLWVICFALLSIFVIDTLGASVLQRFEYGAYPTTQMDVNLGHGGISHLTAYTYGNKIILIESVGSKSFPYTFTLSEKLDEPRLVTITIADVNLDHKPDVLLHVSGLFQSIIFDNTGTGLVLSVAQ